MYVFDRLSPAEQRAMRASGIPMRFFGTDEDWLDAGYPQTVRTWLEALDAGRIVRAPGSDYSGMGLLFDGAPGVGKTAMACTIGQKIILDWAQVPKAELLTRLNIRRATDVHPVVYTTYANLMYNVKRGFTDEDRADFVDALYGRADGAVVAVLILDDLGKEYLTEYSSATFRDLTRARFDAGLPTIITTNTPLDEWGDVYGDAAQSFGHEAFLRVPMIGKDRRID